MKTNRYHSILKPIMVMLINFLLSLLIVIGVGSSIGVMIAFALAVLCSVIYSATVSYDLKRSGLSIMNYILVFSIFAVILVVLMRNHSFTTKLISLVSGNYNLEATGFYLLYALFPCIGGLAGFGLGYGIWKIICKF